jgi:hypothetical protein
MFKSFRKLQNERTDFPWRSLIHVTWPGESNCQLSERERRWRIEREKERKENRAGKVHYSGTFLQFENCLQNRSLFACKQVRSSLKRIYFVGNWVFILLLSFETYELARIRLNFSKYLNYENFFFFCNMVMLFRMTLNADGLRNSFPVILLCLL